MGVNESHYFHVICTDHLWLSLSTIQTSRHVIFITTMSTVLAGLDASYCPRLLTVDLTRYFFVDCVSTSVRSLSNFVKYTWLTVLASLITGPRKSWNCYNFLTFGESSKRNDVFESNWTGFWKSLKLNVSFLRSVLHTLQFSANAYVSVYYSYSITVICYLLYVVTLSALVTCVKVNS